MTPTTVDARSSPLHAGHWAELAGGSRVTEEIFARRIAELEPADTRTRDPVQRALPRSVSLEAAAGREAPGPEGSPVGCADRRCRRQCRYSGSRDAVDLIDELNTVGITRRVQPGTVEQIRSVIRIAAEVPTKPVIVHIEGRSRGWPPLVGRPGRFARPPIPSCARARFNITVCVGGGIGTPERAADYLSGRWSRVYGYPLMPVDGILVGTAAVACLEATTSPSVKQMLVDTVRTDPVGSRRKSSQRYGIGAQPARRRHSRDRQRRLSLWPVCSTMSRGDMPMRWRIVATDHRRDGGRQTLFRRRRQNRVIVAPACIR